MTIAPTAANTQWTPLKDYNGYEHVLVAGPSFVHPANGNIYFFAIEKRGGTVQNLAIYREMGTTLEWQKVCDIEGGGGANSNVIAQIAAGGAVIGQGGALIIGSSTEPKASQNVTGSGFIGVRGRIPGVDAIWGEQAIYARIAELEQRIAVLESGDNG